MRIIKFDDHGLTNECPATKDTVPIRLCRLCKYHGGIDGFDVTCGCIDDKLSRFEKIIKRYGDWRTKHQLKMGMAYTFTGGGLIGASCFLILPHSLLIVPILFLAFLFLIDGKNMVLDHVSALEKQLKARK